MSETPKTSAETGADTNASTNEWEEMAQGVSIEKRLEDGENPEEIIKAAYEDERLTPDFIEEFGSALLENGLSEEKLEYYEQLSRRPKTPEDRRHLFGEEPEQAGFQPDSEEGLDNIDKVVDPDDIGNTYVA